MNDQDELTRALGRELHDRVDGLHGAPISLQDVKGTASAIRRRRTFAAVAGTAAAAAVVPTMMFAGGTLTDSAPEPPPATQSPSVTELPRPSGPVVLGEDAPQGADPAVPYVDGRTLVDGDERIELDADYDGLARAGDEFVLTRQAQPGVVVDVVDDSGTVVETSETTQGVVGSADGSLAAWVTPGGEVLVRSDGRTGVLGTVDGPHEAVAVLGSGSCDESADSRGCVVFLNRQAEEPQPRTVASGGDGESLAGVVGAIRSVHPDGAVAGFSADQDDDVMTPPCSVVLDRSGATAFETCELAFEFGGGGFSPDGDAILGFPSDSDGAGPRSMTVLDARTGDELLEVEVQDARGRTAGSVVGTTWESDQHVLVKVQEVGGTDLPPYNLFRVGLDGSVERVLEHDHQPASMVQPWILED